MRWGSLDGNYIQREMKYVLNDDDVSVDVNFTGEDLEINEDDQTEESE